jgi:hypothetical protein
MWGALIAVVALGIFLLWLFRGKEAAPPSQDDEANLDYEELEEAEMEVRDLDSSVRPGDDLPRDDWGPGSPKPR